MRSFFGLCTRRARGLMILDVSAYQRVGVMATCLGCARSSVCATARCLVGKKRFGDRLLPTHSSRSRFWKADTAAATRSPVGAQQAAVRRHQAPAVAVSSVDGWLEGFQLLGSKCCFAFPKDHCSCLARRARQFRRCFATAIVPINTRAWTIRTLWRRREKHVA